MGAHIHGDTRTAVGPCTIPYDVVPRAAAEERSVEGTSTMDARDAVLRGVLHARGFSELDIEHTLTVKLPCGTSTLRPSHCWSRYTAWSGRGSTQTCSRERYVGSLMFFPARKKKRRPLNTLSETSAAHASTVSRDPVTPPPPGRPSASLKQ